MAGLLALARARLQTIADGVPVLTGKCELVPGLRGADVLCWTRYSAGRFYFLAVGESALAFGGIDAPTSISAYLYSQDADGAAADVLTDLVGRWRDAGNYPGGELVCSEVAFEPGVVLLAAPLPGLVRTRLNCYFPAV